jgi:ketosteroid isomerase-like protein
MSGLDAGTIATTCLEAWTSGDLETARSLLRDDGTFVGPLGVTQGVEEYMAELEGLAKITTGAETRRMVVDGDDVCILYDLVTESAGPLPTSTWYHIQDGKIDSVRAYFDARPLAQRADAGGPETDGDRRPGADHPRDPFVLPMFLSAEMEIAVWDSSP